MLSTAHQRRLQGRTRAFLANDADLAFLPPAGAWIVPSILLVSHLSGICRAQDAAGQSVTTLTLIKLVAARRAFPASIGGDLQIKSPGGWPGASLTTGFVMDATTSLIPVAEPW